MITRAIQAAYKAARERKWTKTYWAIDIHGTMIIPNFKKGDIPKEFYPHVVDTLRLLSQRRDVVLILFTCSHPHELVEYGEYFRSLNIHFNYVNTNPEVSTADYGCFDSKIYFNVLIEDKAGFDPEQDWVKIRQLMMEIPELE
jgi:hypothetical protein